MEDEQRGGEEHVHQWNLNLNIYEMKIRYFKIKSFLATHLELLIKFDGIIILLPWGLKENASLRTVCNV